MRSPWVVAIAGVLTLLLGGGGRWLFGALRPWVPAAGYTDPGQHNAQGRRPLGSDGPE